MWEVTSVRRVRSRRGMLIIGTCVQCIFCWDSLICMMSDDMISYSWAIDGLANGCKHPGVDHRADDRVKISGFIAKNSHNRLGALRLRYHQCALKSTEHDEFASSTDQSGGAGQWQKAVHGVLAMQNIHHSVND